MHRTILQARSYAPTNPPLDKDSLVSRDMGFDYKTLAGKGKLGARAILATYEAEYGALVAKLQGSKTPSALSRRKLTGFLYRSEASPETTFLSKVLSLAARAGDGTADYYS